MSFTLFYEYNFSFGLCFFVFLQKKQMEIIPAIDILDGKCVRLTKGDYNTPIIYSDNPLEVALKFEAHGIHRLHLVDLDGAKSNHIVNYKVLMKIASRTSLQIDFGGGVKSDQDLAIAFESGASMVTVGSTAVNHPERMYNWLKSYGAEKIILGADVREGKVAVQGWLKESGIDLFDFLKDYIGKGIRQVICTDINRDGMLSGPAIELYKSIQERHPGIRIIASGGVSSMEDLIALNNIGVPSVIVGKAYYEGRITLKELAEFNYHEKK